MIRLPTFVASVLFTSASATVCVADDPLSGLKIAARRPNVVMIVTDDQAQWALGEYGNRDVHTPNLDRLFRGGARFDNAFCVTPVCSPSRVGIIASRYGTEVGITDWISPRLQPDLGLDARTPTWPALLKNAGYATAMVGKWHLGTLPRFHPREFGFDRFLGFLDGGNAPMNPRLEVNGRVEQLTGPLPDLLVDEAIRFLDAPKESPFALCLHFREPHSPYAPVPASDAAHYADRPMAIPDYPNLPRERVEKLTREYYASISAVDRNVGRLLDHIDHLSLAENTLVIFTSDHGYNIGHHGLWHKGNGTWLATGQSGVRPNMFDTSLRIPFGLRWPAAVKPGTVVSQNITLLDVFPSILAACEVAVPAGTTVRGRDFTGLLRGQSMRWPDTFFGQYDLHNNGLARMRMVRTPEWKLIRHHEPNGEDELYHLASDPGELTNRAADATCATIRRDLETRLEAWQASIGDPLAAAKQRCGGGD